MNASEKLVKHVLTDPHRSVLLVHTKVEIFDDALRRKLRLYALLAPHGANNFGRCSEIGASTLIHAQSHTTHESGLNLWFVDFPTAESPAGSVFELTCFWKGDQRWQGRNWKVSVL